MEYKTQLIPLGQFDVLVAGSGPSGICAAVAAARCGCRVALVERFGVIGGNLTLGHVRTMMGSVAPGTMKDEIEKLLNLSFPGDPHCTEQAKISLTKWVIQEEVTLFLQTTVVDTYRVGNEVSGLIVSTPRGLGLLIGKVTVDATGDGTVAALSGAQFEIGREDGLMQPASIMFTIGGVDPNCRLVCTHEEDDSPVDGGTFLNLCRVAHDNGELPPNVSVVRLYNTNRTGERLVNATQANGVNGIEVQDITKAQNILYGQINQIISFLRSRIKGFEHCYLLNCADMIGFRETRRVIGEYILSEQDIQMGRCFEDVMVHHANFPFDIHNPDGSGQAEDFAASHSTKPYDIPYRCFLPLGVENLLVTGRCISGTHKAHSSYRVMNICMAMGESIGIAAALSAKQSIYPRRLDYRMVQQILITKGVPLREGFELL